MNTLGNNLSEQTFLHTNDEVPVFPSTFGSELEISNGNENARLIVLGTLLSLKRGPSLEGAFGFCALALLRRRHLTDRSVTHIEPPIHCRIQNYTRIYAYIPPWCLNDERNVMENMDLVGLQY